MVYYHIIRIAIENGSVRDVALNGSYSDIRAATLRDAAEPGRACHQRVVFWESVVYGVEYRLSTN